MVEVQCVDGSVLSLVPVPRLDRRGVAYEVTLRLLLDGAPFGDVGECSGWRLARAAASLRQAQASGGPEAFPVAGVDALLDGSGADGRATDGGAGRGRGAVSGPAGAPSGAGPSVELRRLLPRDAELLCLRSRDPDDGDGDGELRVWLRHDRTWLPGRGGVRGRWSTRSRAVVDCWGGSGRGVRCVLDAAGLLHLLDALAAEEAAVAGRPAPV